LITGCSGSLHPIGGGGHERRNSEELREFLADPLVEELVVDPEIGRIYAETLHSLRAAGTPLPANDIWVAATATLAGATLLTYDRHFEAVQRVGSLILPSAG
jgi:predicted nucleic acid-binding protein